MPSCSPPNQGILSRTSLEKHPDRKKVLLTPELSTEEGLHASQSAGPMEPITLASLANTLKLEFHGEGETPLAGICSLNNLKADCIVMIEAVDQVDKVAGKVAAILHPLDLEVEGPGISAKLPRAVFAQLLEHFHPTPRPESGVHPTATVDSRAKIHPSASVGPYCSVGPGAKIGAGTILFGFAVVGEDAQVGDNCLIQPHVIVGRSCRLGSDCQLEAWAHLGEGVELGDEVDVGAHSSLAHGVKVGPGAKIDNLVVVGPRSEIGAGSLLVGQSAVDRDAKLHPGVVLAGQASVGPGAELVSGIQLGGRALALGKLDKPGPYLGNPAIPLKEEIRRRAQERKGR